MKILEMRPYDKARDEPRTGWDAFSIEKRYGGRETAVC